MTQQLALDVRALIADLGGPANVYRIIGGGRCTPYRCMKTNRMSSSVLERIVNAQDAFGVVISLDRYFKPIPSGK